jgi:phosphoribosylanthranilate isomerase
MTWVKVCGLTRVVDVAAAVDAGADAVGFVAVPGSPRVVSLREVGRLAADVPVTTVILTMGLSVEQAHRVMAATGVDAIQPYGPAAGEVAAAVAATGKLVLLPGPPSPLDWVADLPPGVVPLFDTPGGVLPGGTGETFDWSAVGDVERDFVIAGGLGPHNVAAAVRALSPWGVDASSRLEQAPGVKDHGKVAAFVREARSA